MIVMEMVRINNCHIKNYRMKESMNFNDKKNISHGTVHPSQAWCWFSEPNQIKLFLPKIRNFPATNGN